MEQSESSHGTSSSPAPACQREFHETVRGHRAGYFPLRFDCVLDDGTTSSAGIVSGWPTPVTAVLTAAGLWLWLAPSERIASRARG
jgi:hypothetical protein